MSMGRVYMDNAATTPLDPEVLKAMMPFFSQNYGNASSIHSFGREAERALSDSRKSILKRLNAKEHRLVFTSGGTESNNFAIKGAAFANRESGKKHIITTRIEHDCVLNTAKWLQKQGFEVTLLPVDREGLVDPSKVQEAIRKDTLIVSVIHGNNEIGTIEPIEEIGRICSDSGVLFHSDACQSFTKVPINLSKMKIDMLTINSHKIYGPKGVGGLLVKEGMRLDPLIHGGGQEAHMRSGTENVPGVVGFARAAELMNDGHVRHMEKLRDTMIARGLEIEDSWLNGPRKERLCNNVHFTFKYIEGESLIIHLDLKGIATSTGSACSSKSLEPSHVLTAIGLKPEEAHGSIRISLGKQNTMEEAEYVMESLEEAVSTLRKISPFRRK